MEARRAVVSVERNLNLNSLPSLAMRIRDLWLAGCFDSGLRELKMTLASFRSVNSIVTIASALYFLTNIGPGEVRDL